MHFYCIHSLFSKKFFWNWMMQTSPTSLPAKNLLRWITYTKIVQFGWNLVCKLVTAPAHHYRPCPPIPSLTPILFRFFLFQDELPILDRYLSFLPETVSNRVIVYPSFCLSVCPFIHPSIRLSIPMSVRKSVRHMNFYSWENRFPSKYAHEKRQTNQINLSPGQFKNPIETVLTHLPEQIWKKNCLNQLFPGRDSILDLPSISSW